MDTDSETDGYERAEDRQIRDASICSVSDFLYRFDLCAESPAAESCAWAVGSDPVSQAGSCKVDGLKVFANRSVASPGGASRAARSCSPRASTTDASPPTDRVGRHSFGVIQRSRVPSQVSVRRDALASQLMLSRPVRNCIAAQLLTFQRFEPTGHRIDSRRAGHPSGAYNFGAFSLQIAARYGSRHTDIACLVPEIVVGLSWTSVLRSRCG